MGVVFLIFSRSDIFEKDGDHETDAEANSFQTSNAGRTSICTGVKQHCDPMCLLHINELQIKCVEEDMKIAGEQETVTQVTCIWSQHVLLTTVGGHIHLFGISSRGRGREKRREKRSELARRLQFPRRLASLVASFFAAVPLDWDQERGKHGDYTRKYSVVAKR